MIPPSTSQPSKLLILPRILSISTLYPSRVLPGVGLFVRHRLQAAAAEACPIRIIAPVSRRSWYGAAGQKRDTDQDGWQEDGALQCTWPAWRNVPGLPSLSPWLLYRQLLPIVKRTCADFHPEILDAQFGFPDGPAVAYLSSELGLPYTITLRGSEVLHATFDLRRRQLRRAFEGASAIIAVSERLRSFAISMGAADRRTRTIPNGIDETVFHPKRRSDCRQEWNILSSDKLIVGAGNLIRLKGFDRLIRSVHSLIARGVELRLVIAGRGGFETEFERKLRDLPRALGIPDRVTFCGALQQSALARLMSAADVFVLSSEREGWPNVVHEAMGCGTPIVATDVGGVPDMLGDAAFGMMVPPGDEASLTRAISEALQKEWNHEAISAWARQRGWQHSAAELCATWASVATGQLRS